MLVSIPTQLCDLACQDFEKAEPVDAKVDVSLMLDHAKRDTTVRYVSDAHWFAGIMSHVGRMANHLHGWELNISSNEQIQYAEYEKGQHYGWHIDTFILSGRPLDRKITVVCLLNNTSEFKGGELQLKDGTIPLEKGSIIAFPSFVAHQVTPVTEGIRKTATLWLTGPAFK